MKIRTGYVSNSSSSSFIIINNKELIPSTVGYVKLTLKQKKQLVNEFKLLSREEKVKIDIKDDIYLTEFVSDSREDYGDFFTKNGDSTNLGVYEFHYGGHGYPYNEDEYKEIADGVYFPKDKNENKKRVRK